jgi:thiol-disulfide isomerase/thioredoxin
MMKNIFLSLLFVFVVMSCSQEKKGEFIAQIEGVEDQTEVYLSGLSKNNQPVPIDTTIVQNGSFKFDLVEGEPQQINVIRIDGVRGNMFFVKENELLKATLYKDSLRRSKVEGGVNNQLFMSYMDSLQNMSNNIRNVSLEMQKAMANQDREAYMDLRDEQKAIQENDIKFRKAFAENNPNSVVAALALSDLLSTKKVPNQELMEIYNGFSDEVKDHSLGKILIERLAKLSKTDIGSKVENFEGPSPDGSIISLEDAKGKLTLIDFWASWCKPCRAENPNVVSVYNDFKDKGFSIISISLDRKKSDWEKAIAQDQMDWYHVSSLQYWNEPLAKAWGVRSIPATFLIDENGIIIGKNLRGNALRQKVSQYLDENG